MKKPTVSKLKKELDIHFSRFIRARDKHVCFTCDRRMEPKASQCGHFVPRQYNTTRYNERNCHAQCYACNMLYNGQPAEYALRLQVLYGDGIILELNELRKKIKQWTVPELQTLIEHYKEKLYNLES